VRDYHIVAHHADRNILYLFY